MTQNSISTFGNGGVSFVGPKAVGVFQAKVLEQALRLYAKTGMKVNRSYTPKNMIAVASQITGRKFQARDYLGAANALSDWINKTRDEIEKEQVHA